MAHTREQKSMSTDDFIALFHKKLKLLSDLGETFRKIEPFFMTIWPWEPRPLGILFKTLEDNCKKGFDRQAVMNALNATNVSPREVTEIICRPDGEERNPVYKNDEDIRNAKTAITEFLLTLNKDAEMLNFANLYFKRQREFYQSFEYEGTNNPKNYGSHYPAGTELNQILKTNKVTHLCTYSDKSAHTFDRFVKDNRPLTSDLVDEMALDFFAGREMKKSGDLIPSLKKATKEIVECYDRYVNPKKEIAKQPAPVEQPQPVVKQSAPAKQPPKQLEEKRITPPAKQPAPAEQPPKQLEEKRITPPAKQPAPAEQPQPVVKQQAPAKQPSKEEKKNAMPPSPAYSHAFQPPVRFDETPVTDLRGRPTDLRRSQYVPLDLRAGVTPSQWVMPEDEVVFLAQQRLSALDYGDKKGSDIPPEVPGVNWHLDDAPVEDTSVKATSVKETSVEDTSVKATSVKETSVEDTSVKKTSVKVISLEDIPISPKTETSQAAIRQQLSRVKEKEKETSLGSALAQPSSSSRERKEVSFGAVTEISSPKTFSMPRELPEVEQPTLDDNVISNLLALLSKVKKDDNKQEPKPKPKLTPKEVVLLEGLQNTFNSLSTTKHRHSS